MDHIQAIEKIYQLTLKKYDTVEELKNDIVRIINDIDYTK